MKEKLQKRRMHALIVLIMVLALVPILALAVLADDLHKINEIELEIVPPIAGNDAILSFAAVELGHPDYKVVGINWYKDNLTSIDDRMGINSNESTFIGGHSYTVKIDLALKNTKLTEWDKLDGENKYSNINATINGMKATIEDCYPSSNWDRLCVVYKFENIPFGKIRVPSLFVNTPIAGELQDMNAKAGDESVMYVTTNYGYNWYVQEDGADDYGTGWRYMQAGETYIAGRYYKLEAAIQAKEGFVFDLSNGFNNDDVKFIRGYINGKEAIFRVENDERIVATFDIKCQAKTVDTVTFREVLAPAAGQHPNYNMIIDMDNEYRLFTHLDYTGGQEYGFINGLQWTLGSTILNSDSVFEAGKSYTLSFFIKSHEDYLFAEWLEAASNIGYAEAITDFLDPSVALVQITFAPCGGGAMTEANIGGVTKPATGNTPDYDIQLGNGTELIGDVEWYEVVNGEKGNKLTSTSKFEFGHKYMVVINLSATQDYSFVDYRDITAYINGEKATSVLAYGDSGDSISVSMVYNCTVNTIKTEDLRIDDPTEDLPLPNQITALNGLVNITGLTWTLDSSDALDNSHSVLGNKQYFLVVALSPKEGYRFDAENTSILINNAPAYIALGSEDTLIVRMAMISNNAPTYSVSFTSGEGVGTMDYIVSKAGKITLPECTFTAPDGKVFSHWEDGNGNKYLGEIMLSETLELTAIYVDNEAEHTHIFGDTFNEHDGTFHWKKCLYGLECPDYVTGIADQSQHIYDNNCDAFCNDCGYERELNEAGLPLHFYVSPCAPVCPNCGLEREASHKPGANATCKDAQKCTVCGDILSPALGHSFGVEYLSDENGHYKLCACGERSEAGNHVDANEDKKCDICGYDMKSGLPVGAIIGIVIGAIAVLGGGGFAIYWFVIKAKKASKKD